MHRTKPPRDEYSASMRAYWAEPVELVLPGCTCSRKPGKSAPDALDRRAVHTDTVLRQPQDDWLAECSRTSGKQEANTATYEADGHTGGGPQAWHQPEEQGAQNLPISTARC